MKISVLGNIIDTKKIYRISNIITNSEYGHIDFEFVIDMYNKKQLCIRKSSGCYINYQEDFATIDEENFKIRCETGERIDRKLIEESKTYLKYKKQIETLRNVIIAYWSNNQSDIPKIEFT